MTHHSYKYTTLKKTFKDKEAVDKYWKVGINLLKSLKKLIFKLPIVSYFLKQRNYLTS